MTSALNAINQAYGYTCADNDNLVRLQYLFPFWSLILYHGGKGSGLDLKKPVLVKAIISSTIIGVPVNIGLDLVASLTTQVAGAILGHKKN